MLRKYDPDLVDYISYLARDPKNNWTKIANDEFIKVTPRTLLYWSRVRGKDGKLKHLDFALMYNRINEERRSRKPKSPESIKETKYIQKCSKEREKTKDLALKFHQTNAGKLNV